MLLFDSGSLGSDLQGWIGGPPKKESLTYTADTCTSCSYGTQVSPNDVFKRHDLMIAVSIWNVRTYYRFPV